MIRQVGIDSDGFPVFGMIVAGEIEDVRMMSDEFLQLLDFAECIPVPHTDRRQVGVDPDGFPVIGRH